MRVTRPKLQPSKKGPTTKEKFEKTTGIIFYLSIVVAIIGFFMLFTLMANQRFLPANYANRLATLQQDMGMAITIFAIGLWVMALLALVRWPTANVTGWVLLIGGMALYLVVTPILIKITPTVDLEGLESPARAFVTSIHMQGWGLIFLGGIRILIGLVLRNILAPPPEKGMLEEGREAGTNLPKRITTRKMARKCWETSFCRNPQREICPRYKKKSTCWKHGSGCLCDTDVAIGLAVMDDIYDEGQSSRGASSKQKSRKCPQCPIYQTFQEYLRYRSRVVAWFVYPVMIGVTWALSDFIRQSWFDLDRWLSHVFGSVSVLVNPTTPGVEDFSSTMDTSWLPVVVVGLLLISAGLRIVHKIVHKFVV